MNFVTLSDFDLLPYAIPNLDKVPNAFTPYVTTKQAEVLRQLLGAALYTDFMAGLAALPDAFDPTIAYVLNDLVLINGSDIYQANGPLPAGAFDPLDWTLQTGDKWVTLRDGADYILSDTTYHWDGIKALLVPYIYSEWLRDRFDNDSGSGVTLNDKENAKTISPTLRICKAHNAFVDLAGGSWRRFPNRSWNYAETYQDCLYGFLLSGTIAYPNLVWGQPEKINSFGF